MVEDKYQINKKAEIVEESKKIMGFNSSKYGSKDEDKEQRFDSKSNEVALKREIGLFSAICLIVSVMIGSGIFISPSSVLEKSGSVGLCLIVWAVCGCISYLGALAFAELGTVVPHSGAEYAYFQAAFTQLHAFLGPLPGFIYVWVMVLVVRPAEVAILVLTFSEYVYTPIADALAISIEPHTQEYLKKIIGLLGIGMITYINFTSVKLYVKIQNMFSSLKILACVIVIIGGLYDLAIGKTHKLSTGFEGTKTNVKDLVLAFYSGLWAFDGWTSVTVVTEEIKAPEVNIPRSISIGVPLVTLLYFMMNVAYMTVLDIPEIISAQAVAIVFSERVLGPLAFVVPVAVALSTFGCGLSVQFGVSRLCFVAGRVGHMVESFSYIHMRRYTPAPAVLLQGILTALFILSGSIIMLIEFVSFLIWIFYGMAMFALIVMRKTKANTHRPYKVPLIVPIFIMLISIVLAGIPLVMSPDPQYLIAIAFIGLGVGVYYPYIYKKKNLGFMGKLNYFVQVLFEVVPQQMNYEE